MNARYILLLQRQFDEKLSERETYELEGFLAGNESAARLCENVRKLIEECEQMEPPENFKPEDEQLLLIEIVTKLRKSKSKSWIEALSHLLPKKAQEPKTKLVPKTNFVNKKQVKSKRGAVTEAGNDELAVLRSKRKDKRTVDRDADAIASMRSKFVPVADSVPADFVHQTSLAEAIKNKLQQNKHELESNWEAPTLQQTQNWDWSEQSDKPIEKHITDLIPPQTTTQAAEPNHYASDMRSADSTNSADPPHSSDPAKSDDSWDSWHSPSPIAKDESSWSYEFPAPLQFQSAPPNSLPDFSSNFHNMPIEPKKQPLLNATSIPVDEIIAHVSEIFSEHEPISPIDNDPLGATSGVYPQIREQDLRAAKNARLSTAFDTTEHNGKIQSLGKFLLDKHSEAAIGNLNISNPQIANARILSDAEAQALQDCLTPIQKQDGVAGCVIVGYDGMIITSTLPPEADKDAFSAWALFTYINSHELVRVIGHSRLRQLVSKTGKGYLLLADFGQGLLVAVSDNAATEAIVPLMKSVRKVTAA